MNRFFSAFLSVALVSSLAVAAEKETGNQSALDFKAKNIDGEKVDLHDYKGKVVLVVNTASQCGLTPQYSGLEALYQKHKDKGFVVLGFPCNQFGGQEPGDEAEIKRFCSTEHNVTFPMFSKVDVNGDDAAPLYKYLTSKETKPKGKGSVSWNFEKFLIDREGNLVHRFAPNTRPSDAKLNKAIEANL